MAAQKKQVRRLKKRIALISTHGYVMGDPPLGAPDTGGQVVFVLELAQKLGLFGYKVDIWTRQFEKQPASERLNQNVRILRVPCGGDAFIPKEYLYQKIPEWVENTRRMIRKKRLNYDFINSHYWDAGLAGMYLSEGLGIPHLHTPHSIGSWKKEQMEADYPGDASKFEAEYNFTGRIRHERQMYNDSDAVIATTPIQADKLMADYDLPPEKIRTIPPGYDDTRFYTVGQATREYLRERFGFKNRTILTISRLAQNKGLDLLLDGFHLLSQKLPDVDLFMAVGHEDRNSQEQARYDKLLAKRDRYKLQDRVTFAGFIPDEELADYYRAADVFVLPSRYEPFGMTAVEAMACGTPTVVTIHGGLYRILEYGIHTVFTDPFDKEDLGITMMKALQYPSLRRRLSQSGSQIARSRFTWTGIAQQLLNAVESLENGHL